MQRDIRTLKQTSRVTMIGLCHLQVGEVGSTHPWEPLSKSTPPLKLNGKSSGSRGKMSRSQRDITCAKICKIINNSAGDWSISLKFCTNFDHVTFDVPQTLRSTGHRSRSQRDITYQHKNAIIQARISCRRSNLGNIISKPSAAR